MFRSTLDNLLDVRDAKRAERQDGEAGFTLIELLVVVVIIGILIAIAIPLYLNYTKGAKNKGTESDVRAAVSAVQQCYTDNNNTFPITVAAPSTAGTDLALTCGSGANATETSPVSSGTILSYTNNGDGTYLVTGVSDSGKTYTFSSSTGKIVTTNTAAA